MAAIALTLISTLIALLSPKLSFNDYSTALDVIQQKIFGLEYYIPTSTIQLRSDEPIVSVIDTGPSIPIVSYDIGEPDSMSTISTGQIVLTRPVYVAAPAPAPVPPVVRTASFVPPSLQNVLVNIILLISVAYQQRRIARITQERDEEKMDAGKRMADLARRAKDAEDSIAAALEFLRSGNIDEDKNEDDARAADDGPRAPDGAAGTGRCTTRGSRGKRHGAHDAPTPPSPAISAPGPKLSNTQRRRQQRERAAAAQNGGSL